MSGGVDSCVAAFLLARAGWQVIGVTLKLADLAADGFDASRCCSAAGVAAAQRAARMLGIPHILLDVRPEFRDFVLTPFVDAYLRGETPSPCVHCNSTIKFGRLVEVAAALGAAHVATGHYARRVEGPGGDPELHRARERARDQSYFLFEMGRDRLKSVLFPLGEYTKDEVRALARQEGLPSAALPDSQDMCFVPLGETYVGLLQHLAGERLPGEGEIVDGQGRVLGRHGGIHRFTVGQRRGLGVSSSRPLFVSHLDARNNRVVVGGEEEVHRRRIHLRDVVWLVDPSGAPRRVEVQVRSRHRPVAATVTPAGGGATVEFVEPVLAPSPGQAAVWYEGDRVLGGGWIVNDGRE
ncbi:MAG: tRNA 2-thiouridine(34) synthase MnmA [Acidobacteriota bacterium]|jgi:tRNA-specific 2-thiouridylase